LERGTDKDMDNLKLMDIFALPIGLRGGYGRENKCPQKRC